MVAALLASCESTPPSDLAPPGRGSSVEGIDSTLESGRTSDEALSRAFREGTSDLQVLVRGSVSRILADDLSGDKHQRFIVKLSSGQTLLVAHNIDLAERVPVKVGMWVYLYGEYEWNAEGGVVHWTHKDPGGTHVDGWIQAEGVRYE
ncbi:MAG: DUF3465 domain-containing protein [Fibrobacteria bacterium]|nr:DUF3465 domain-containing protein [Fibrobacteria bacterium]